MEDGGERYWVEGKKRGNGGACLAFVGRALNLGPRCGEFYSEGGRPELTLSGWTGKKGTTGGGQGFTHPSTVIGCLLPPAEAEYFSASPSQLGL